MFETWVNVVKREGWESELDPHGNSGNWPLCDLGKLVGSLFVKCRFTEILQAKHLGQHLRLSIQWHLAIIL